MRVPALRLAPTLGIYPFSRSGARPVPAHVCPTSSRATISSSGPSTRWMHPRRALLLFLASRTDDLHASHHQPHGGLHPPDGHVLQESVDTRIAR
eukprot:6142300-Pyramimonas_sp.AAC.1